VRVNGIDALALTKLDVARGRGTLRVCVGYRIAGTVVEDLPDLTRCQDVVPIYEEYEGWEEEMRQAKSLEELPRAARTYIGALENLVGVPFELISVGPERSQTVMLRHGFG
jgi:adenylosuccinate synthase